MSNLDLIIKDLNKKMKVGNIQLGVDFQEVQKIPFSSCRLNYMTYGGIPVGRIAEFYGADGSGKTTTAIDVAGNAQKMFPDKKVLFVDIEHTFDSCWATKLGLNCDDIIYLDPDSMGAEEVFNMMIELIDIGEISLCILDSIGAMVSMQANEKQIPKKIEIRKATNDDIESELRDFITVKGRICRCPSCRCCIHISKLKYCWECGQKIDWSDEE